MSRARIIRSSKLVLVFLLTSFAVGLIVGGDLPPFAVRTVEASNDDYPPELNLDALLGEQLRQVGFTGRIGDAVTARLRRPINPALADIGRLLWFDTIHSLGNDNTCAGCHSPTAGFGDTQSIAIGVDNNGIVGPHRAGPRNQRRTPQAVNIALAPALMWNARFAAISHDPFSLGEGVRVPFFLGGLTVWRPGAAGYYGTSFDPRITTTLLAVKGNFPPTETIEVAGHAVVDPASYDARIYYPPHVVSSGLTSDTVPAAIAGPNGSPPDSIDRSYAIRAQALDRINATPGYVERFGAVFPEVRGGRISFAQFAAALAEFQLTLVLADAPLDRFARGDRRALTAAQKRGAWLFFGRAACVQCHAVAGESNELFSDFQSHVAAIPQVAPAGFGLRPGGNPRDPADEAGNFEFSGDGHDEDFGREELTGDPVDRYAFRTSPLRNVAVQPTFFHNGAFTRLRDAITYHVHTGRLAHGYSAARAGLSSDLTVRLGPIGPALKRLDPRLVALGRLDLSPREVDDLVEFVSGALLDPRALPENLCRLIPDQVPSGRPLLTFEGCPPPRGRSRR